MDPIRPPKSTHLGPTAGLIAVNVKNINTSKSQKLSDWIKKQTLTTCNL